MTHHSSETHLALFVVPGVYIFQERAAGTVDLLGLDFLGDLSDVQIE